MFSFRLCFQVWASYFRFEPHYSSSTMTHSRVTWDCQDLSSEKHCSAGMCQFPVLLLFLEGSGGAHASWGFNVIFQPTAIGCSLSVFYQQKHPAHQLQNTTAKINQAYSTQIWPGFMLLFLQHIPKAQVYPHLCLPQNRNQCTNNWKIPSTPPSTWKKRINFHLFPVIFVFLPLNQVLHFPVVSKRSFWPKSCCLLLLPHLLLVTSTQLFLGLQNKPGQLLVFL